MTPSSATAKVHINENTLPATFRTASHDLIRPEDGLEAFITSDVSVQRIERMWRFLWMCGRPYPPRPLNVQAVLGRQIVATTDANLHLVWTSGTMYLKPLPSYLLSLEFYKHHLKGTKGTAVNGAALGLLYTYLALVPNELDFKLAEEARLFPPGYKWDEWMSLARQTLADYPDHSIYQHVSPRYIYGELRLTRLDLVRRYLCGKWLHGYSPLIGSSTSSGFFEQNLAPVVALGVYIVVILTAMSVGLTTPELQKDVTFRRACYGFTIFSIVTPMFAIVLVVGVFLGMLIVNWSRTLTAKENRFVKIGIRNTTDREHHKVVQDQVA